MGLTDETFQNVDWRECPTHVYLAVQKNGHSYIMDILENREPEPESEFKPRWMVVRDPYDRFVSGLAYDLMQSDMNVNYLDKVLSDPASIMFSKLSRMYNRTGKTNHSAAQSTYIINQKVDVFVNLSDLTEFCDANFGVVRDKVNETPKEFKEIIEFKIDKEEMMKLLTFDYYVYNSILQSERLWKWQYGKIF